MLLVQHQHKHWSKKEYERKEDHLMESELAWWGCQKQKVVSL